MDGIPHRPSTRPLLIVAALLLGAQTCPGVEPSIVSKSPFLPPNFAPPGSAGSAEAPPASASQYQFRGVYQMEGEYFFHLYNTRDKKGSWISKASSGNGTPKIIQYKLEDDVVVIDVSGKRVDLAMVETSDRPMPLTPTRPSTPRVTPASSSASAQTTTGQQTPVRRRVIRPTTRNRPQPPEQPGGQSPARRPTLPANLSNQETP
jgi:hypothetical protein